MTTLAIPSPIARRAPPLEDGLENGDRLSQAEFHRRYELLPPGVKAELIGGVVHMPSPLRIPHGRFSRRLSTVLGVYEAATPGVEGADNVTVILGDESEPQPDLCLRVKTEYGGRSHVNTDEYLVGPPELIIEVAHSSVSIDLHAKRHDYERAGVLEYLVLSVGESELHTFDLAKRRLWPVDPDGIYRSKVFPGLWIDAASVLADDVRRALRVLNKGLKSPEHVTFVKRLKATVKSEPAKPSRRRRK